MKLLGYLTFFLFVLAESKITLRRLSSDYVPWDYMFGGDAEVFKFNVGLSGMAVDALQPFVYAIGDGILHVLDFNDTTDIKRVDHYTFRARGLPSRVATCEDIVAVSYDNYDNRLEGQVYFFDAHQFNSSGVRLRKKITVGPKPISMAFTKGCAKLLVTIEGPPVKVDGEILDQEGEIVAVIMNRTNWDLKITKADFTAFNPTSKLYTDAGVRWSWHGEKANITNTFSQNIQPFHIALSADHSTAYVTLPDNNAIAVLDVEEMVITDLHAVGSKSWLEYKLDPSDQDGGPSLNSYDIQGMYQPTDIISWFSKNRQFILVADQGHPTNFTGPGYEYTTAIRGEDILAENLIVENNDTETLRSQLADPAKLGRLLFTRDVGLVDDADYENVTHNYTILLPFTTLEDCKNLTLQEIIDLSSQSHEEITNDTDVVVLPDIEVWVLHGESDVDLQVCLPPPPTEAPVPPTTAGPSGNETLNSTEETSQSLQMFSTDVSEAPQEVSIPPELDVTLNTSQSNVTSRDPVSAPKTWVSIEITVHKAEIVGYEKRLDTLYTFGGRGFSVYEKKKEGLMLVYTSGDVLERNISASFPEVFNSYSIDPNASPESERDKTSTLMGPGPDAVAHGTLYFDEYVGTKSLVFVGMRNPGFIGLYSLPDNFAEATTESLHYTAGIHNGNLWKFMWKSRRMKDADIKQLILLPGGTPPNPGKDHLLFVLGADSGTVSLYQVYSDFVPEVWDLAPKEQTLSDGEQIAIIIAGAFVFALILAVFMSCYQDSDRNKLNPDGKEQ